MSTHDEPEPTIYGECPVCHDRPVAFALVEGEAECGACGSIVAVAEVIALPTEWIQDEAGHWKVARRLGQ